MENLKECIDDRLERPFKNFRYSSMVNEDSRVNVHQGDSPKKPNAWKKDDFTVIKQLGHGRFAVVYSAVEKATKREVAIKQIAKKLVTTHDFQHQLRREVEIHARLNHPNIVKLFGYFQDNKNIYLVMELVAGGTLYDRYTQGQKSWTEAAAKKLLFELLHAVAYLEKRHIIHRDIKLENILLDCEGHPKLSDFGWAVHAVGGRRRSFCGTLMYLSPEQARRDEYSHKVDVWNLGVLAFELLTGIAPFSGSKPDEILRQIQEKTIEELGLEAKLKSPELKNLLKAVGYSDLSDVVQESRGSSSSL